MTTSTRTIVPTYDELLHRTDAPPGSSWGVFGPDNQLGTLNFLTAERTAEAAKLVRRGATFNLDYPLNEFVPSFAGTRPATVHNIFANDPNHRDDWVDSFYLQSTSQVDGLRHIRHPQHGFYNGVHDGLIDVGKPDLGVQLMAERAIAGRGVLLDAKRYFDSTGEGMEHNKTTRISASDLDRIAEFCQVEIRPGDLVLLRTGWAEWWDHSAPENRKLSPGSPGLDQSHENMAWIWDHQVALIAADNAGLESGPYNPDSPFYIDGDPLPPRGAIHNGGLHRPAIPLLGIIIGELWKLDTLAADCAEDGVYEFLLTVSPLNLKGAVGSPPNAIAIK